MTDWGIAVRRWLIAGEQYREATAIALEGFACAYCGSPAQTIDHVQPRAAGGSDDIANLVPACRSCNASKSAKSLESWVRSMREQLDRAETLERRLAGAEAVLIGHGFDDSSEFASPEFLAAWDARERKTA